MIYCCSHQQKSLTCQVGRFAEGFMQKWVENISKEMAFMTELQYMGNTIFMKDRRECVKPLRSRLETIQKLKHPTMVKGCKSFAEMVNFVTIICPELQKLLKPIYDFTKKGRHFIWGKEQQAMFEEIKSRLQKTHSSTYA